MRKTAFVGVLLGALALCVSASGQGGSSRSYSADKTWQTITFANGCKAVLSVIDEMEARDNGHPDARWSWNGGCKDGLIDGQGVLATDYVSPANEWGPRIRFEVLRNAFAEAGLFQGRASELILSDADDYDEKTPPGSMQPHNFGDFRNPQPSHFQNGCGYYVDEQGRAQIEVDPDKCDPAKGVALRDALRAKGAAGTAAEPQGKAADALAEAMAAAQAAGKAQCALDPDQTLARFNEEVKAMTTRYPLKNADGPAGSGAKAVAQWTAFVGTEGLKILEPYRECLGPHYSPNRTQLDAMRDTGLSNCGKLSTTGQCVASYPY